jgi:sugar phosphate isomerase/epimerase
MGAQILGIMTRHVQRRGIEEVAEGIASYGLQTVQLSLKSAGFEPMPGRLDPPDARRIARAFESAGVAIAAVSGTFNVIDLDRHALKTNLERFALLCGACADLGTSVVTTCTGTRDRHSMWRAHPENLSSDAWDELVEITARMATVAHRAGVVMAFEPETANVVDTLAKAQALVEAIRSPGLAVTFDPANFFYPADLPKMGQVIREGFERLAPYIALAHAKDVIMPADGGSHCHYVPAGKGLLDYPTYLRLLEDSGYTNGLIMHSLSEADISGAVAMIRAAEADVSTA